MDLAYLSVNLLRALSQLITGRLLSERQIQSISSHVVGQFVADWLPERKAQTVIRERVDKAKDHLAAAAGIVSDLKAEIDAQSAELDALEDQVQEKRKKVEQYTALAQVSEPAMQVIRSELERSVRGELEEQAKRGRGFRLAANFVAWLITLLLGAALGSHWGEIEEWLTRRDYVRETPPPQKTEDQGKRAPNSNAPTDSQRTDVRRPSVSS